RRSPRAFFLLLIVFFVIIATVPHLFPFLSLKIGTNQTVQNQNQQNFASELVVTNWEPTGTKQGQFDASLDIAINLPGFVHVSETNGNLLQVVRSSSNNISDWFEDCSDISDWINADGTSYDYSELAIPGLTDSLTASGGVFTPDSNWWNPPASTITPRDIVFYRQLPTNRDDLLIESTVNFNPTSVSNPYSFMGTMNLLILGENLENLFLLELLDSSGSANDHKTGHRAFYFDVTGGTYQILPMAFRSDPVVTQGKLSIIITNTSIRVFTPVSETWTDLNIDPSIVFQRSNPTFLALYIHRSRQDLEPAPAALNWDSIEAKSFQDSTTTTIQGSSLFDIPLEWIAVLLIFGSMGLVVLGIQAGRGRSRKIEEFASPIAPKAFFCQLDNEQHPATDSAYECSTCSRMICEDCYTSAGKVGIVVCPYCQGNLKRTQ
ncbi:MAG: hypothetical protein ACFFE8_10830, partial [Candidatus Heimdallarchaeota archaeon]